MLVFTTLVIFLETFITVFTVWCIAYKQQLRLTQFIRSQFILVYSIFLAFLFLTPSLRYSPCSIQTSVLLTPFSFVTDYIREFEHGLYYWNNNYIAAFFDNPVMYQVIFNILIFVPIGYVFAVRSKSIVQSILFVFLISLAIELVQLSKLFGFASCNYRVFDVNDLILNTLGGCIGAMFVLRTVPKKVQRS